MSDVFLLYLFEIFEEENGVKRVFPPSLQSVDNLALVDQIFLSLCNILARFDQQFERLN